MRSTTFVSVDHVLSSVPLLVSSRCVFIPESCEALADSCFAMSWLSRVTFASGSALKRIGKEAFRGCMELKEIEVPAGVEELGEGCFKAVVEDVTRVVMIGALLACKVRW